ncbi:MAG: T9SS type A sorting domain-containing protein, partial [Bacteroidota bacterium]
LVFAFGEIDSFITGATVVLNEFETGAVSFIGDSIEFQTTPYRAPGQGGGMIVWDYSDAVNQGLRNTYIVDPATAPNAANFPEANRALEDGGALEYSLFTDSSYVRLGINSPAGVLIDYTVPETLLQYPLQYEDTFQSSFSAQYVANGIITYRSGTVNGKYDAYGTLILPWGTINDVVRVNVLTQYRDSINNFGTPFVTTTTINSYLILKEGNDFQLVGLYEVNDGMNISQSAVIQSEPTYATNIEDGALLGSGMEVYPNPVKDQVSLKLDLEQSVDATLLIENQLGQVVKVLDNTQLSAGTQHMQYTVSDLSAGVYFLCLQSENGSLRQKLIKR